MRERVRRGGEKRARDTEEERQGRRGPGVWVSHAAWLVEVMILKVLFLELPSILCVCVCVCVCVC